MRLALTDTADGSHDRVYFAISCLRDPWICALVLILRDVFVHSSLVDFDDD